MPDVFVATDKPKEESVVMHKRTPLSPVAENEKEQQDANTQNLPSTPINVKEDNFLEEKKNEVQEAPLSSPQQKTTTRIYVKDTDYEQNKNSLPAGDSPSEILADDQERRNGMPLFTSFWQNPQGVYFDTQEANEHILLFLRRHFITNFPWIFTTVLFLFLPFGVNYLVSATSFSLAVFPAQFVTASIFMYYLLVISAGFLRFLDWYFNISLITARRVMDIELKDLVYKKISATKISLVQDVNYQQAGTIRTIFNYGDILVQTAGATDNFFVNAVPKPEVVVEVLETLIGKGKEEKENAPL